MPGHDLAQRLTVAAGQVAHHLPLFGHRDVIAPAVARAAGAGYRVTGPVPSDTVFVRALKGEFDAVLTMYPNQGQIAMELVGFDRGVTLIAGDDSPIVTPAHGSAFDIAGQGRADPGATLQAARLARDLARLNQRVRLPAADAPG